MKGCYEALLIKEQLLMRGQSIAIKQAYKAFFHSRVCCDICKIKQFNVKKLFVTQACLHDLHYIYLTSAIVKNSKIILFGQK